MTCDNFKMADILLANIDMLIFEMAKIKIFIYNMSQKVSFVNGGCLWELYYVTKNVKCNVKSNDRYI